MEKKVIVVGAIGKNERKNRDSYRVILGGGISFTLQSHIEKEQPLVLKSRKIKYEKKK